MNDCNEKLELTTIHWVNIYNEDDTRDTQYFFGNILVKKSEIVAVEEAVREFHEHCFLCCNVYLRNGEVLLVKENYYELSAMYKTFS